MNLMLTYPRIVFFTGAGMSKESGVPTYRGEGGLWKEYRYQDYACQSAFENNPEAVWNFHDQRRAVTAACQPHVGHELIARLAKERQAAGRGTNGGVTVVTQNIDGMHQRAGSEIVYELHGSLWRVRCDSCCEVSHNLELPLRSRVHHCGNFLRPDIVWFGDSLSRSTLTKAVDAISRCSLFVSIGTSGAVYPAARLPLHAIESGAACIEINPESTPVSQHYQQHLRGPASVMLPQLLGL
ncbi:NAD-dependent deacylase [bacterium]|nr:NAD-dependent deacylase [bacterium]